MELDSKNKLEGQKKHWLLLAAVFFCFLALYAVTAQRGVSWQDSGEYQYKFLAHAYAWEVGAGIARLHPSYTLITRGIAALLPFVPVPFVYTLSSGIGMSVALCALSVCVYVITKSVRSAAVSVVLLGGAQMAWWLSTLAEVYTWSLAFLMLEVMCLSLFFKERHFRWFVCALFFNGCHLGVHHFALLNLPLYAFIFLKHFRKEMGAWALCAGVWCLGALPIIIPSISLVVKAQSLGTAVQSILFGNYFQAQVLSMGPHNWPLWFSNMALTCCSFCNPCWLYAGFGIVVAGFAFAKKKTCWAPVGNQALCLSLLALTGIHFVFWVRYFVPDQATFVLPTLGMLSVWAGIGVASFARMKRRFVLLSLTVSIICSVLSPLIFCHYAKLYVPPRVRALPFRDEFAYWAYPWKHTEDSAERFIAQVAAGPAYPDRMVAWVDTTAIAPLMVAQAMGRLPSSWTLLTSWQDLQPEAIERRLRDSPNGGYVLSPIPGYTPSGVLNHAKTFEREGCFYRIIWPR